MISLKDIFESNNPEQQYIRFANEKRPLTTIPSLRGGEIRAMQDTEDENLDCADCDRKKSFISIYKEIVKEQDEEQPNVPEGFKEDPMGYILKRYKKLYAELERLMGEGFEEYLDGVFIVSGKPTTFKIHLKNHQYFFMTYMGKGIYEATVLGKRYYLSNLGDVQRATKAVARILRFGPDLPVKGPEEEQGPDSEKSTSGTSSPSEEAPTEETPEEETA